eukprot:SAG11_NODE_4042_length_2090_cov_2.286791_1_plen_32_part_10
MIIYEGITSTTKSLYIMIGIPNKLQPFVLNVM